MLFLVVAACGHRTVKLSKLNKCKVGIVGGGPAGVYTAYRLIQNKVKGVCLFEKESEIGGRIKDKALESEEFPRWIGTGARRVNKVQKFVLNLGKELGIKFERPQERSQLIFSNNHYGYSADDFVSDFPGLIGPLDSDKLTTREDEIFNLLFKNKNKTSKYPLLKDYIASVAGPQAIPYLKSVGRFHADYEYEISTSNYLETIQKEYETSSVNLYPVGGMGMFVKKMVNYITLHGGKVFTNEGVNRIDHNEKSRGFTLITKNYTVPIQKLIIAAAPNGLRKIRGNLAEKIIKSKEFNSLLAIPVVVINQWWKNKWWSRVPNVPNLNSEKGKIWRAWSNSQCVNHTEIPQEEYAAKANAVRSVYTEDPKCVKFWLENYNKGGIDLVENKVVDGLVKLFNHRSKDYNLSVPKPIKTDLQYWPAGWYYIKAKSGLKNKDIVNWALKPLDGIENFSIVGEAYWPDRPGWSEGAYFSANNALRALFNLNYSN